MSSSLTPPGGPVRWNGIEAAAARLRWMNERQRPFFLRWVRRFLTSREFGIGCRRSARREFLESLRQLGRFEEWQIRQAEKAVAWFQREFSAPGETEAPALGGRKLSWEETFATISRLLRQRDYAYRTEQAYLGWVRRYHQFVAPAPTATLTTGDAKAFLSHLAVSAGVAAKTQNQAFHALRFLYVEVLDMDFSGMENTIRAQERTKVPVVLSRDEMRLLLSKVHPRYRLIVELLYGTGMRVTECKASGEGSRL